MITNRDSVYLVTVNTTDQTRVGVDPRPVVRPGDDGIWTVSGSRCARCARAVAYQWPRCPGCAGEVHSEDFAGTGVVWSRTTINIAVGDHVPPYTVAYVDLDNGPRMLAHVAGENVDVGARVRLVGLTPGGDPRVEEVHR